MNIRYACKVLFLSLLLFSPVSVLCETPKLLCTMRIGPLTEMADKVSKFSSGISKNLTSLPYLALAGLSFTPGYMAMDFNSEMDVFFYSVGDKSKRRIAWLASLAMNPSYQKRDLPIEIQWFNGKKARLRRFKEGIIVAENAELLAGISKLPPGNGDDALISLKFNSAEYLKYNRDDFIALRESYLDAAAVRRMTRDFGPVIADLIISRINDLEYVMSQSSEMTVILDFENDAALLSINAKPAANTRLAAFVNAQKEVSGEPPPLASGRNVALRGNIVLTPELRQAMNGLGRAENILMSFSGNKGAGQSVSPLLAECVSGKFSWFADQDEKIPAVGAFFYNPELKASKLQSFAGLKKTAIPDIYRVADYLAKHKKCSVFFKPKNGTAAFAAGCIDQNQAASLLNTGFEQDREPVPVYGELRSKEGGKAATFSGHFKNNDLNLNISLYPGFAVYFIPTDAFPGGTGKKDRRKLKVDIRKMMKK